MTNYAGIIICSTGLGFCISFILLALWEKAKNHKRPSHKEHITRIRRKLDRVLESDSNRFKPVSFKHSLQDAAMTTDFQVPRLKNQYQTVATAPEKYTILSKLLNQGLEKQEIASILNISIIEVSQLVTLRSITEQNKNSK
jgi:hypothetical protein